MLWLRLVMLVIEGGEDRVMRRFAVLHARKIDPRALGGGSALLGHCLRSPESIARMGKRRHVDPRLGSLVVLAGPHTPADVKSAIDEKIARLPGQRRKPRKDAVRAVEFVLSASPAVFYDLAKAGISEDEWENAFPGDPGYADMLSRAKAAMRPGVLDRWVQDSLRWLREEIGQDLVVSAVLHLDEKTPHIHAVVVPAVKGRLTCKEFFTPDTARRWQDTYARYTGLRRGIPSDRAHEDRLRYEYRAAQKQGYQSGYLKAVRESKHLVAPAKFVRGVAAAVGLLGDEEVAAVKRQAEQVEKRLRDELRAATEEAARMAERSAGLSRDLSMALRRAEQAERERDAFRDALLDAVEQLEEYKKRYGPLDNPAATAAAAPQRGMRR